MFKDSSEVLAYIKDEEVLFLDIRFTDLPGVQQHFNIPASTVDEEFFSVGQLFVFLARDIATAIGFVVARVSMRRRRLRPTISGLAMRPVPSSGSWSVTRLRVANGAASLTRRG